MIDRVLEWIDFLAHQNLLIIELNFSIKFFEEKDIRHIINRN
jgi:hypothetical protein